MSYNLPRVGLIKPYLLKKLLHPSPKMVFNFRLFIKYFRLLRLYTILFVLRYRRGGSSYKLFLFRFLKLVKRLELNKGKSLRSAGNPMCLWNGSEVQPTGCQTGRQWGWVGRPPPHHQSESFTLSFERGWDGITSYSRRTCSDGCSGVCISNVYLMSNKQCSF